MAVFAVCILSGLAPQMMGGDGTSESGSLYRQLLYTALAVGVLFALRPLGRPARLLLIPLGLCVPLAWAAASVAWALNPGISVRRLLLTAMIMWSIFSSVRFVGYERTVSAMRIVLVGFLVANYATVLIFPEIGIHLHGDSLDPNLAGDWRGMMDQKNFAGPLCATTALMFILDGKRVAFIIRWSVIAAALYFLYKTGSRTSVSGFAGALAAGLAYRFYNARYRNIVLPLMFSATAAAAVLAVVYVDPWQFIYGNSAQLSGRTEIWQVLWRYIADHWLLGSGYGSFWGIGEEGPVYRYGKSWLWTVYEGHNGYLDLLATIGVPGLALVVLGAFIAPISRLLLSRVANGPNGAMLISLMIFAMAHNMSESTLFDRDMNSWTYMLFAIALTYQITPDVGLRFVKVRPAARLWRVDEAAQQPMATMPGQRPG